VTVSAFFALACIVVGVGVGASPLNVNPVAISDLQGSGHEVILHTRVDLHDVAALASNLDVNNFRGSRNATRTGANGESVRSVLESSSILSSVDSKLQLE